MPAKFELTAQWKSGDYDFSKVVIPPGKPIWRFEKQKARADMADYTLVDEVALSYGDLHFQIVPVVRHIDRDGTLAARPSSTP